MSILPVGKLLRIAQYGNLLVADLVNRHFGCLCALEVVDIAAKRLTYQVRAVPVLDFCDKINLFK